jgi:hypothetical protein
VGVGSHGEADDGEVMHVVEGTLLGGDAGAGNTLHEQEGLMVALVVHSDELPKLGVDQHLDPSGSAIQSQLLVEDDSVVDVLVHNGVLGLLIAVEVYRIAHDTVGHKLPRVHMLPHS